jgi:hypothetical protein
MCATAHLDTKRTHLSASIITMTISRQLSPDTALDTMGKDIVVDTHSSNKGNHTPAARTNKDITQRPQHDICHDASSVSSTGTATTSTTLSPSPIHPSIVAKDDTPRQPKSILVHNRRVVRNDIQKARKVKFTTITTRYFPMTIGDNPAVTRGVPLAIDWKCIHTSVEPIQTNQVCLKQRNQERPLLSSLERARILKDWGYTKMELAEAIYRTNKLRAQRKETADMEMAKLVKEQRKLQQHTRNTGNGSFSWPWTVRAWNAVRSAIAPTVKGTNGDSSDGDVTSLSPVTLQKV